MSSICIFHTRCSLQSQGCFYNVPYQENKISAFCPYHLTYRTWINISTPLFSNDGQFYVLVWWMALKQPLIKKISTKSYGHLPSQKIYKNDTMTKYPYTRHFPTTPSPPPFWADILPLALMLYFQLKLQWSRQWFFLIAHSYSSRLQKRD